MPLATPVAVALKSNPEVVGTMVDVQIIPLNGELIVKSAVVWDHPTMLTPCPSFHSPEELIGLGCPFVDNLYEDDEDEDEEEEETGEQTEVVEPQVIEGEQV